MLPKAIVEHFYVDEHVPSKLRLVAEYPFPNAAGLEAPVEGFHGRVVVAVSLRAHARFHAESEKVVLIGVARVGAAAVAVVDGFPPRSFRES